MSSHSPSSLPSAKRAISWQSINRGQTTFIRLSETWSVPDSPLVLVALYRAKNNQAIAAEMLGITRQALSWRLKLADRKE